MADGSVLKMDLCAEHLRNAVRIAEVEAARTLHKQMKVSSMSFHHLALSNAHSRAG
jgi:hypothetical protein